MEETQKDQNPEIEAVDESVGGSTEETSSAAEETVFEGGSEPQDDLMKRLEAVTAEVAENKERYIRAVAELENYRKRAVRDREEARRQAGVGFVEDILPVLENFGLGLQSAEQHESGKVFADGFRMVFNQLKSALEQNGVVELNPEGEAFDPNWHESIAQIPHDEIEDGHIIEVQRVGFKFQDRLVRPAMVVVSSGAAKEAAAKTEES